MLNLLLGTLAVAFVGALCIASYWAGGKDGFRLGHQAGLREGYLRSARK